MEGKEGCEQNCDELTELKPSWGTSLVVQRLWPHLPEHVGSISRQGVKDPTCLTVNQNIKQKTYCKIH